MKLVKIAPQILLIIALSNMNCSSPIQLTSYRNEKGIKVDGLDDDWEKQNMEIVKDSKIAVGICYDEHYLYMGLAPLERSVAMQMMITGFTVWFDSLGRGNKIMGIRYPIGREGSMPLMTRHDRGSSGDPFADMAKEGTDEVEIIGPGALDRTRLTLYELSGVAVKLTHQKEGMFYELRVPLRVSEQFPYGINFKTGRPISILLETGDFKRPDFQRGMANGGQQRGGGMRDDGPNMVLRPEMPKKMKVLLKTTLSGPLEIR